MGVTVSPTKRTKFFAPTTSSVATVAADVILVEPALLETIVGFIPQDTLGTHTSKTHIVLTTIASLCRAFPTIGRLLGPSNERLWRTLVLSHFDFAVSEEAFDLPDECRLTEDADIPEAYDCGEEHTDGGEDWKKWREENPDEWQAWCANPAREPLLAWDAANSGATPDSFLQEPYDQWKQLDVFIRPGQYGFLAKIQQDKTLHENDSWPAHEDAFSLFCDLVILEKMAKEEGTFQTISDSSQCVTPCLLSKIDEEVGENGWELLRNCGLLPHYWNIEGAVRPSWKGFDGPPPSVDVRPPEKKKCGPRRAEYATEEELDVFPICEARDFVDLRRLVYDSFDDWRSIHLIKDAGVAPVFYLGRSKRSGRWIGLMGISDY